MKVVRGTSRGLRRQGKVNIEIKPDARKSENVAITDEIVKTYSLDKWADDFWLMTAGYRDPLDPNDISNPEAPFNAVTIVICSEAKARVFKRKLSLREKGHVHIGGEVRPHTQDFIKLMSRVYAAHGFIVHLRKKLKTTPIWYSSFGIAYEEYQSGDNFTASHSQYFKGGWKPLDGMGKQLLIEEQDIIDEVKNIVKKRQTIRLSPWNQPGMILHDFDVDKAYVKYQRQVIGDHLIKHIRDAGKKGFKTVICTVGGSMKATTERIFEDLGISCRNPGIVKYIFGKEDEKFHGLGQIKGENFGVDPGKWQIYKNVGIQTKLLKGKADIAIIWDPDGDRIKIASSAPISDKDDLIKIGVEIDEHTENDKCVAYFTPHQLYVMVAAFRLESLRAENRLDKYDWFIGASYPTTKALEQLAIAENIRFVQVPVGFKHVGDLCEQIENQQEVEVYYQTTTGQKVHLGKKPRAVILCEESGGGNLGGSELLVSKCGKNKLLALHEKDGMQLGLIMMALAAKLSKEKSCLANYYAAIVKDRNIRWLHYIRKDLTLYDERLLGAALNDAKAEELSKRDRTMAFFKKLVDDNKNGTCTLAQMSDRINGMVPKGVAGIFPTLCNATWISDGALLESDDLRFILRASGTDAVLRYYFEGKDLATLKAVLDMMTKLKIDT
jgi:phosphomannomutase